MTAPPPVDRHRNSSTMPMPRIVSVSPKRLEIDRTWRESIAQQGAAMFITPRVIDQSCFNDFAQTLRALIDEAVNAAQTLATQVSAVDQPQSSVSQGASELQERLRLGARMLSAFQTQIVRIETALSELEQRERAVRELVPTPDQSRSAAESFRKALDSMVNDAVARVDAHVQNAADLSRRQIAGMLRAVSDQLADKPYEKFGAFNRAELSEGAD